MKEGNNESGGGQQYHERLRNLMDEYVHRVFQASRGLPKEEIYGTVSQWRRAALSVILNYIEGYARQRKAVHKNFLETSYGSLKESAYLSGFCRKENWIDESTHLQLQAFEREIGAMLWGTIRKM